MSQSHFTLSFPVEVARGRKGAGGAASTHDAGAVPARRYHRPIHYSRFTVLSEKTLLFLGDFDGEFSQLMADLAKLAGPVFDAIFQHVDNPPPTPVANNAEAFVEWTASHLVHAVNIYTAYPDVTAKEIKALASAAGRQWRRRTTSIPGDPANQIKTCLHRGSTDPARAGARDNERPGQSRHTSLRTVRAAGGQPDWLLYRL